MAGHRDQDPGRDDQPTGRTAVEHGDSRCPPFWQWSISDPGQQAPDVAPHSADSSGLPGLRIGGSSRPNPSA
jgi:hypothetical protein